MDNNIYKNTTTIFFPLTHLHKNKKKKKLMSTDALLSFAGSRRASIAMSSLKDLLSKPSPPQPRIDLLDNYSRVKGLYDKAKANSRDVPSASAAIADLLKVYNKSRV